MDLLGLAGLCGQRDRRPHRMGAALTYARRYALFALVEIAGEDDLDAVDPVVEPTPARVPKDEGQAARSAKRPANGSLHRPPVLGKADSIKLRDVLIAELEGLDDGEALALWAHRRLPAKNSLTAADAGIIDAASRTVLDRVNSTACADDMLAPSTPPPLHLAPATRQSTDARQPSESRAVDSPVAPANAENGHHEPVPLGRTQVTQRRKLVRHRSKAHLLFGIAALSDLPARAL